MQRIDRRMRSFSRAAMAVLAAWLLVPALAEAQQPLFPNLTTHKRTRPSCEQENPVYSLYRRQYYGYYPTCWRAFPQGWGCPSSEAPNRAQAMAEIQKEIQRLNEEEQAQENTEEPAGPDMGAPVPNPNRGAPPGGEAPPPLPRETSPFATPPAGGMPPKERSPFDPPPAGGERSPFDPPPATNNLPAPGRLQEPPPRTGLSNPGEGAASQPPLELAPPPLGEPAADSATTTPSLPTPRRTLLGALFGNRSVARR